MDFFLGYAGDWRESQLSKAEASIKFTLNALKGRVTARKPSDALKQCRTADIGYHVQHLHLPAFATQHLSRIIFRLSDWPTRLADHASSEKKKCIKGAG